MKNTIFVHRAKYLNSTKAITNIPRHRLYMLLTCFRSFKFRRKIVGANIDIVTTHFISVLTIVYSNGRGPGLVVKGGDSCCTGRGFKSHHCILHGHFSHLFVVKIVLFV